MKNLSLAKQPATLALVTLFMISGRIAPAANNWNTTANGLWRTAANWSLGTAPSNKSNENPVQITNAATKTVTIDSATAAGNLALRGLTIAAPLGATNTLALVNVPLGTPLNTSNPLLVGSRAIMAITNSAVSPSDTFDVQDGTVILAAGSLNCPVNCDLQSGLILVTGGTLNATVDPLLGTTGLRMGRFAGANANLTINGGTVNAARLTLGSVSGSANTLTIAGGALNLLGDFSAAQLPLTTANVFVSGGSLTATNGFAKIADRSAATFTQSGGTVSFGDLSVGDLGVGSYNFNGGTFNLLPFTSSNLFIIANMENGDFNQRGGVALIRTEIHVADFGGVTGNLNLMGGQFYATNDLVAIGREGIGSLTISNATAVLTNTSVGRHLGSSGALVVQSGANLVFVGDLSIGRLDGASGSVLVESGQLAVTNDDLWIGRAGSGTMTVASGVVLSRRVHVGESEDGVGVPQGVLTVSGGILNTSSNLVVGTPAISTGQLTLTGGAITVTNSAGNAFLAVNSGLASVSGGVLIADQLMLTNASSSFTFDQGTMRVTAMNVSNGQPFVVGDGVHAAVLELKGGTFSFANGLVISPNASVTGCGTVIGPITNNGIYSNPCGAITPSQPNVTPVGKVGNTMTLSCPSQNGFTYTLEYKLSLGDTAWTSVFPGAAGNGGNLLLTDPAATNQTRFYRVRVQ